MKNQSLVLSLTLTICSLALSIPVHALTCEVSQSCSGTTLLRMSGKYNAHAELPSSPPNFNWLLCCHDEETTIGTDCNAADSQTFLLLSDQTNAHVSTTYGSFPYEACISTPTFIQTLECVYDLDTCPVGYACLASLYGNTVSEATNTHISACDDFFFRIKICCRISTRFEPLVHNISEFTTRRLYTPHDTIEDILVKVMNNHTDQSATIQLSLDGPATFQGGPSRIAPIISPDGKTAIFNNLPPKSEDIILVTISSLFPLQDGVYTITLMAASTVESSPETDVLEVVSHQPPTFSGLPWFLILLLFIFSALLFYTIRK